MKKIKIVFVQHSLVCGGAEQALYDLVSLLDKEKFDISVFVQSDEGQWRDKFYNAGIHIVYDYSCRKPTWNPIKKFGNVVKKFLVWKSIKNDGKGLLDICCPGADLVVTYSTQGCNEIGFAKGAKAIQYVHVDIGTNQLYRKIFLEKMEQLPKFDKIICVSEQARKSFCEQTGLEDTVEMHFNPLNSDNVQALAQQNISLPEDLPIICAVGRLSIEKGFDRLIYIHRRLLDRGVKHRLVLVGDGEDMNLIRRMVRATGTEESVILAGYQENPYPYMKASKFLVNSSYTEGLPVIAMEALSLGVPIVAPIPSVGEAFGEECCGLITENDSQSLEEGIYRMLTDENLYQQAKAGAQRRSAYFDGKRMVKEIEDLFLSVVQGVET